MSCVALTNVVVRLLPFHWMTEVGTKPLPATVSVKAAPFCCALPGESEDNTGAGFTPVTVKAMALDVPPPGAGVVTVTAGEPALARSPAGMLAVSCVALTKVVGRLEPFHCTVEAGTKPEPVTVSVKAAPFWRALLGESDDSAGDGFTAVMVKATELEVPPPGAGLTTATEAGPAVARSLAGMLAESWVALTNVVARGLLFHWTAEAATKPLPVTVSVKAAPPCSALFGESEARVGAGFTGAVSKVAVTLAGTLPTRVQDGTLPPQPPPDQLVKFDPFAGVAVSVTARFGGKEEEQAVPQLIPAGLLLTVPDPVPVLAVVSVIPADGVPQAGLVKADVPALLNAATW
ncbi:MAG TPA: hypothetical protein VMI34_07570 [Candidatus Bathyarchaeia archaeon]|nr:hypothetical protein [Candidatus Bathyarchaeia archaeon]